MSTNNDIRKKPEGQQRALEEHKQKERDYVHQQDKDFARKTQERILKQIADLEQRMGSRKRTR